MSAPKNQNAVLEFVREVIQRRTGDSLVVTNQLDQEYRNEDAVDELWDGRHCRYAVEHTRVESFEGQIANGEQVKRLLSPARQALRDRLPGYFVLQVRADDLLRTKLPYVSVSGEIERLVLEAVRGLPDGAHQDLMSSTLPFVPRLHRRHSRSSGLVVEVSIEGESSELRHERFHRAFDERCPKPRRWAGGGRRSVLILESDDPIHADAALALNAVRHVLASYSLPPDIIVYVETEEPWHAFVFKDGVLIGDDAMRTEDGGFVYERRG